MAELEETNDGFISPKYLTEAQLKKLLQYVTAKADSSRQTGTTRAIIDEFVIFLQISAGLRPGELCNLNIEDLPPNQDKSVLLIRDSAGTVTREIEIDPETIEYVKKFIKLYRTKAKPDEPMLVNERGGRFTYRSLYNKVKNVGINSGIEALYPHMLRNTFIVKLYNDVKELRWVQQQAGHQSPKTTAFYTGKVSHRKRKAKVSPTSQKGQSGLQKNDDCNCDACGRFLKGEGQKIDSGQILCSDCLKYFQEQPE